MSDAMDAAKNKAADLLALRKSEIAALRAENERLRNEVTRPTHCIVTNEPCHLRVCREEGCTSARDEIEQLRQALGTALQRVERRKPPNFYTVSEWARQYVDSPGSTAREAADAEAVLAMIAALEPKP